VSIAPPLASGDAISERDVREGRVAQRHAELAATLGSVFASVVPVGRLAGPCVVLVGNDALAVATGEARETLSSEAGWAPLLGTRFGCAVINADEPQHMQDRRRWGGAFSPAELAGCLSAIRTLVARRAERWATLADFEPYPATRELAFAAIATTLGGFRDDATLSRVLALLSAVLDPPPAGESDLDQHRRVLPLRDELEALLRAQLGRAPGAAEATTRLVDHLRRQDPAIDSDTLLAHLNLLLITGHETTASLMAWMLNYASMPRWLGWLREELDRFVTPDGEAALTALEALPRLDAFVREVGRLQPPLLCAPRVAVSDVDVAGVRIPVHSRVVLGYGGTNRLASAYAEPHAFRPQRWLDATLPRPATFSAGHRLCLGMRFALMEAKAALAHVVTQYDVERIGTTEPVNAGFWNARPAGGPRLALRRRAAAPT
jgi:retinoid hydroxylase